MQEIWKLEKLLFGHAIITTRKSRIRSSAVMFLTRAKDLVNCNWKDRTASSTGCYSEETHC